MSNSLRKVEYRLNSSKLKKPVTIAMLADLHNRRYGEKNQKLLEIIRESNPDMILLSGDMVVCREKQIQESLETANTILEMAKIAPVYYGIGNHEAGVRNGSHDTGDTWKKYVDILSGSKDIYILENKAMNLEALNIKIYGLDLPPKHYVRFVKHELLKKDLDNMLGKLEEKCFNILLSHHPDYFKEYCVIAPDLIVSGHNHGGMVRFPVLGGVISPRLHPFPKYDYGLYESGNTKMIVTGGAGLHSINLRINNPPEVVIIHIDKCE